MTVFIVFQWRNGKALPEVQGVFSTKELAEAACKSHLYLVAPFTLDEALSDEPFDDGRGWFPLAEQALK